MQGQSVNLRQKQQSTSLIFLDEPESSMNQYKEFIEDQCNNFFKDLTLPSKSYIIDAGKEENFALLQTFDEDDQDQQNHHEFGFQEHYHSLERKNQQQESRHKEPKRTKKIQKSGQYSKNYRQKKKNKTKALQEENLFLKNKIDEFQNRLRQKQLELSRIKYSHHTEDYSINQLNAQIIKKLNLITDSTIGKVSDITQEEIRQYQPRDKKIEEFLKFYQVHGFGGQKTQEALDYYVNEFLENIMRDREKYHFLTGLKKKYLNPTKTPLDIALQQVVPRSDQQKKQNMAYFDRMRPLFQQLLTKSREFYQSSQEVVKTLNKIQQATKGNGQLKIEEAKKRMKTALWFHVNQYRKEMRNLRAQWIDLVKKPEQNLSPTKPLKKKKSSKTFDSENGKK